MDELPGIDLQTNSAADRVWEAVNGAGPSVAYPHHGANWREAFEADASVLARYVRLVRADPDDDPQEGE